ncbi:uncharacterized protein [Montipora capricornis]|uniref:uncharacterized protein n=1 Tax=Montipora foliosa TaxID=591990 RepID=UPI0035F14EF2
MEFNFFVLGTVLLVVAAAVAEVDHTESERSVRSSRQRQHFSKCWNQTDCGPKKCCAGVSHKRAGVCVRQPQLKEKCNPYLLPGSFQCPCRVGMTCSTKKSKGRYGRCVYVTPNPDEVDESTPQWIY